MKTWDVTGCSSSTRGREVAPGTYVPKRKPEAIEVKLLRWESHPSSTSAENIGNLL